MYGTPWYHGFFTAQRPESALDPVRRRHEAVLLRHQPGWTQLASGYGPVGYQWTHHQFLGFIIKIRNYIMYCYYIIYIYNISYLYIYIHIYIYTHIIIKLFGKKTYTILPTLVGYIPRSPPLLLPSPPPDVKVRVCSMISGCAQWSPRCL